MTGQQVSCKETGQVTVTRGHWVSPEKFLISYHWAGEGAITRWSAFPGLEGGWESHRFPVLIFPEFQYLSWCLQVKSASDSTHPETESPGCHAQGAAVIVVAGAGKGTWQFNHLCNSYSSPACPLHLYLLWGLFPSLGGSLG